MILWIWYLDYDKYDKDKDPSNFDQLTVMKNYKKLTDDPPTEFEYHK